MGESTHHRDSRTLSLESIETLPNDAEGLKALLREQTEAFEALTQQVEATARAEDETQLRDEQLQHFHRLQALGTLAGGIAHEFNNILAAMLGFTEITQSLLPPESPARRNLQEVYTAGQRAREIIRQTLSYSRSATTVSQPLAYAPLVTEVLGLLRASLPKTIEIRDEIAADVGTVLADPASMHQVLMNLCTNAAHALSAGGVSSMSTSIRIRWTTPLQLSTRPCNRAATSGCACRTMATGFRPRFSIAFLTPFLPPKQRPKGPGWAWRLSIGL